MWRSSAVLLISLLLPGAPGSAPATGGGGTAAHVPQRADSAIIGRWDLVVQAPEGERPSWLEVKRSGREALVGQFVGPVGSARPVAKIEMSGDSYRFAIPPQWEQEKGDIVFEARAEGGQLAGTMTLGDGRRFTWTGKRAPAMRRSAPPAWGTPIRLINPAGLAGWHAVGGENQWRVANGILRSDKSGANLVTDRKFTDFKLHVEFRYPRGSNSGIYLRGRHEVQIQDDYGAEPANDRIGSVYGFIAPSEIAARPPGEWQTFDITLVGRMLTVVLNGKTVICNREIPGITGGALDSDEGAPGPIYFQGDHGPIEFRNITITPAR